MGCSMLGVFLALAVAIGPEAASPEDSALVSRLGSTRYVERESAEAALIGRGRAALPALRAATGHRDLEVRVRVGAILRQVERSLVLQPTPILLDFRDAPLADVLRRVDERSDLHLAVAARDSAWSGRKVTLEDPAPLPFWSAIDRLREAGRLSYTLVAPPEPGQRDGSFVFQDEPALLPEFVSDSGPFRSQLASIAYQSEMSLSRPRPAAAGSDNASSGGGAGAARPNRQMYLQLLVAAEPRLAITQDGPVRLLEAVDERGQSLVPTETSTMLSRSSGYFGMNPTPQVRLRVDLSRPEEPGRRIARIRGSVPVMVSARMPEPLVVPLAEPLGRVHRNADATLVVRAIRAARGDQPAAVELTLRGDPGQEPPDDERADHAFAKTDVPRQQLEVLDARGNPLAWFPSATQYSSDETRLTLTVPAQGAPGLPATIRYHGIVRIPTEVAFEFRDVPMP